MRRVDEKTESEKLHFAVYTWSGIEDMNQQNLKTQIRDEGSNMDIAVIYIDSTQFRSKSTVCRCLQSCGAEMVYGSNEASRKASTRYITDFLGRLKY